MSHIFRVIIGRANVAYPRSNSWRSVAGAVVTGAIVTGAIVGGAIFAGAIVVSSEHLSPEQLSAEQLSAEQMSAEQMSAEQMSPEQMSRSICRVFRSNCRRSIMSAEHLSWNRFRYPVPILGSFRLQWTRTSERCRENVCPQHKSYCACPAFSTYVNTRQ